MTDVWTQAALWVGLALVAWVWLLLKIAGVYPVARRFGAPHRESAYTTLLMSTGLTFGTIAALFGLNNGFITTDQYSILVAAVIGSAVIPTLIANAAFLPRHLMSSGRSATGPTPLTTQEES